MTHEYRLEEVDAIKSREYADDKKKQKENQEKWLKNQEEKQETPQSRVAMK